MPAAGRLDPAEAGQPVRLHRGARLQVLARPALQFRLAEALHQAQSQHDRLLAVLRHLHRSHQRRLVLRAPAALPAPSLPADVGVVDLHRPAHLAAPVALQHGLLLPGLGTAAASIALVAGLFLAAALASLRSVPAAAAAAMAAFPALDLWVEATQYVERNAYADYRIVELEDGGRMLEVSGQGASRHDAEARGWDYAERIERTLCEAGESRVLVLGAAGMTLGKGAACALDVTFVDIDPAQQRIAGHFLEMPAHEAGRFAAGDARAWLRGDAGGWEAIVVDTYSNSRTIPQHLLTAEFYRLARARLVDGGSLYVNQLTWPQDVLFRTRAERTLRSVFADCSAWPVGIERGRGWHEAVSEPGNLLFRCRRSDFDGDSAIYSDAVPRADLDRSLR